MDLPIFALGLSIGIAVSSAMSLLLILQMDNINHAKSFRRFVASIKNV